MSIVTSTAVQTLQALIPTIVGVGLTNASPQAVALITLLPAFVQAAETISAANGATPEQLMTMFAAVSASIQNDHDQFMARQAARGAAVG